MVHFFSLKSYQFIFLPSLNLRMRTRIITYILLLLSVTAQTKRALVIGLGEQQDKAWNKINGDKDVPLVQGMLKSAGFKSVTKLFIKRAKNRIEKQVKVSFLFKI